VQVSNLPAPTILSVCNRWRLLRDLPVPIHRARVPARALCRGAHKPGTGCVHCSSGRRARPSPLPGRTQTGYWLCALERVAPQRTRGTGEPSLQWSGLPGGQIQSPAAGRPSPTARHPRIGAREVPGWGCTKTWDGLRGLRFETGHAAVANCSRRSESNGQHTKAAWFELIARSGRQAGAGTCERE